MNQTPVSFEVEVMEGFLYRGKPIALLQIGVAEPIDPAEFTTRPRWGWINREPVDPPPVHLVSAA